MKYPTNRSGRDPLPGGQKLPWAAVACFALVVFVTLGISASGLGAEPTYWDAKSLPAHLSGHLRLMGHRNWIVVADSAYPWQSRPGIQTVYVHGDHLKVVDEVLQAVGAAKHVKGAVHLDAELKHVPEKDAPGVEIFRKRLAGLLKKRPAKTMPHEDVIARLDEAAKTFRVLIVKTDMVIPYTSVFIELDCGYWSAEKEKRLREAIDREAK